MKKKISFILFTLLCFSNWLTSSVHAEENQSSQGGYSIEGIANEHQISSDVSYFYLYETPGSTDQLKVKLINQSDSEKILQVKVTNANTNSNGLIDYTGKLPDHQTLKTPLTSLLKPKEEHVTVPAHSEKIATLDLAMPPKEQSGIILGGIVVSDITDNQTEESQLSVGNTYSYTLGVVLTNDKEGKISVDNGIDITLEKVEAKSVSGKRIVQADILNDNPYMLEQSTVEGKILSEKGNKVLKERKVENVRMAPYSVYPFQFDWEKENLEAGTYIFKGSVKTANDTWEFTKTFTITDKETKEINKKSVFNVQIPSWLIWSLFVGCILSVVSALFMVFKGGK
ncbi:DUF916 and DUF3324 domain-containing protein [Enterococcus faecium]|uniref:DUF916 and DUF3324 domain-containing protein n=1 Tax=Enterococcus faecium TaxID=1352 RepID=UPI0019135BF3|nr:DUF916 and DUF3324 domain-containing protein [Enterococcus faecium]MBK5028601.1 DUF916 and DUF3324 domain-containing protein [Enterococcus faecium]MBK5039303.1 DUF916 and DUF3324 domain-containing protein [Enterococcus faecium]MBK5044244.1 DUF916 and DUF3324 domain-containing protein [Enterococcus faecium]MBK5069168.1 DUF916 and DUF3324 domain-containing protein [Enterococcus faecium]MBK5132526.1 DUF916 and DUF3324 domain-containing protein [Enterococcus faecium]